jgi:hypothetical protein
MLWALKGEYFYAKAKNSLGPSCDVSDIEVLNQNHLKLKVERRPPLHGLPSASWKPR